MNLQDGTPLASRAHPSLFTKPIDSLAIHHLRTRQEIEQILHLREAIDLSVHTACGTDFFELEKKETNAVLSALSN